jgi:3-dehydroquinate dehydratase/shikimate dehydrogenase
MFINFVIEAMPFSGAALSSPFPGDRVCAVVAAPTASEAKRQFKLAAGSKYRSRTVELRLDYLRSDRERDAFLDWLSKQRKLPCIIATCRTKRGGGRFGGSDRAELDILAKAVEAGCKWCDVEIQTARRCGRKELRKILAPARLLISLHDFRGLPTDLPGRVKKLRRHGADVVKVAATCRSLPEVKKLLRLAAKEREIVVIPMIESGDGTRILALREGSALAYAPVAESVAPGQLSLDAMHNVFRVSRRFGRSATGPTGDTRIYAVIGDPIGHSLSPLMHNAAFAATGMDSIYLPFRVRQVADFIQAVRDFGISGFSVTIPHKQKIIEYLDGCDSLAAEIGAVNTVQVRGGKRLYGYNTDYAGVLKSIEKRVSLPSSRVLLLGAGGAARAAAFALAKRGASVFIWARRPQKARSLARAVGGEAIAREALRKLNVDAIVNCTPIGMYPGGGAPLSAAELRAKVIMDLIYRPMKTELLEIAERRGIETISGVEMFIAQGAAQWEIWTGKAAPEKVMRQAVIVALKAEEKAAAQK